MKIGIMRGVEAVLAISGNQEPSHSKGFGERGLRGRLTHCPHPARTLFSLKTWSRKTCKFAATFAFLGRKGPFCVTKMFSICFVQFFVKDGPQNMLFWKEKWHFCSQFCGFGKLLHFFHFSETRHSTNPLRRNGFREMPVLALKFDIP